MNKPKLLILILALTCSSIALAEIKTVPYVDPNQYIGDWYQIAHIPQFFEGGACPCARQRLSASSKDSTIGVYNSCNDKTVDGPLRDITGTATSDDPNSNSKFTVDFGFPWKGSYWIIGLEAQYKYSVVTSSDGSALYILSRTPTLDSASYQQAVDTAVAQGIDISKLEFTVQKGCSYP